MASVKQDQEFLRDHNLEDLLSQAVTWIAQNMAPEDVFHIDKLRDWARCDAATVLSPEEIFADTELEEWATSHRFTKEEPPK